jgi:hypothetical protein
MIDYEQIRIDLNAVWVSGVYSKISPTPTNKMLIPGLGPYTLPMAVAYYKVWCKNQNKEPTALNVKKEKPNLNYSNLFDDEL